MHLRIHLYVLIGEKNRVGGSTKSHHLAHLMKRYSLGREGLDFLLIALDPKDYVGKMQYRIVLFKLS